MSIIEKYRPKTIDEWIGVSYHVNQAVRHVELLLKGRAVFRCILLVGRSGTGKTSLAYLVANHLNLNVVEVNASDKLNNDGINELWKTAITTTLDDRKTMILLDESDGFSESSQRRLAELIYTTPSPIIICVNEEWNIIREIREKCLTIKLDLPSLENKLHLIKIVADCECFFIPKLDAEKLAMTSTDYRSLLNRLFMYFLDDSLEGVGSSNFAGSLVEQVSSTLHGRPPDFFGAEPGTVMRYLFENTTDVDIITDADLFLRYSEHDYKFWRYASEILKQCRGKRTKEFRFPRSLKKSYHDYKKDKIKKGKSDSTIDIKNEIIKSIIKSKTKNLDEWY